MTCNVSLGDYDGDVATFYDERWITARKPHACYECRATITVGERYERVSGKWDGEVRSYYFCAACAGISAEFSENGRTFGVVWDAFEEQWSGGANLQACLNRVSSVAAKAKLREQWQKFKGLRA